MLQALVACVTSRHFRPCIVLIRYGYLHVRRSILRCFQSLYLEGISSEIPSASASLYHSVSVNCGPPPLWAYGPSPRGEPRHGKDESCQKISRVSSLPRIYRTTLILFNFLRPETLRKPTSELEASHASVTLRKDTMEAEGTVESRSFGRPHRTKGQVVAQIDRFSFPERELEFLIMTNCKPTASSASHTVNPDSFRFYLIKHVCNKYHSCTSIPFSFPCRSQGMQWILWSKLNLQVAYPL